MTAETPDPHDVEPNLHPDLDEPAAADDPTTAAHERRKTRAFATVIVVGAVAVLLGLFLVTRGGWGIVVGSALFVLGGAATFAAGFGFYYRHRARRTLMRHPWRTARVAITGRAPEGSRGKLVVRTEGDEPRAIVITGASPDLAHRIALDAAVEYAGSLDGSGLLFVRALDGEDVYVATMRTR